MIGNMFFSYFYVCVIENPEMNFILFGTLIAVISENFFKKGDKLLNWNDRVGVCKTSGA